MSRIDNLLEKAGSEFRHGAAQIPDEPWTARSRQRARGMSVAVASGVAVLVLAIPLAIWLGSGATSAVASPVLQTTADVVFEGDDWIVGFHEETIPGSSNTSFCWEFNAVGRGLNGADITETGCQQRGELEENSQAIHNELYFDMADARVWVVELRPGSGGEIKTRVGRTTTSYEGQRMSLSRADIFAFEEPLDGLFNMLTFNPPYGGIETAGQPQLDGITIRPDR